MSEQIKAEKKESKKRKKKISNLSVLSHHFFNLALRKSLQPFQNNCDKEHKMLFRETGRSLIGEILCTLIEFLRSAFQLVPKSNVDQ